jgi:outer membrane protein assembly factor BamD
MKNLILIAIVSLIALNFSCSGKTQVRTTERFDPEKYFETANQQFEKKDYEEARSLFLEIKNRDLTRKFAPLAQLRIADSYVQEDEYDKAIAEYNKFLETYPEHSHAAYAQYQIAMIYFNQIESPDRGYGGASKALEEFEKLKKMFPRNPYKDIVELKIEKCKNVIAEYEFNVAEFYYKKGSYNAAIGRLENLLSKFPGYKKEPEVLSYLANSYKNIGNKEKAIEYLNTLISKYPNHKTTSAAKKELSKLKP